ncbi:MAG: ASPIC/UnbV domain-containing protein, partial [Bacteroidota bacterium]
NDFENGELSFTDVSGEDGFATVTSSMAFELFDYDHDGDLDVLTTGWRRPPTFHENRTIIEDLDETPNWVAFSLEGTTSNKSAIGTKIEVISTSGLQQTAYYSGVGFMTQSLQPVHFGLGSDEIRHVRITWPLGLVEEYDDVPSNKTIAVVEGEGYAVLDLNSVKISGCTDPNSCSYNPRATTDDGSCQYLESKSIVGSPVSGVYQTEQYSYPTVDGNVYSWSVEDGHIIEGQGTGSITVQWEISQSGEVSVIEMGECYSAPITMEVMLDPALRSEDHSIARLWSEVLLEGIRNDFARPTVHARNLFHASAMMYDLWVLYHHQGSTYLEDENYKRIMELTATRSEEDLASGLEIAISHAMYKLMRSRFVTSPDRLSTEWLMLQLMDQLALDISDISIDFESGDDAAIGNYVAEVMIEYGYDDGSREQFDYRNSYYTTVNTPLNPDFPGNPVCEDPNRWQPLQLVEFIDQSGNLIGASTPQFLSPEWGNVKPFALEASEMITYNRDGDAYNVFHDPGTPPLLSTSETSDTDPLYKWGFSLVSIWGAHLDPNDEVMWDISPASIGNISLEELPTDFESHEDFYNTIEGGDIGKGRSINPHTGAAYQPQMVPRGDYARVLAEFWADGPDSETPPGHWYTLLNYVNDHPQFERKFEGNGESLDILEWDVRAYFALGGAMHDAAISAWSVKGWYDYIRPVSAIRFMADRGQSSDPNAVNYHPQGIPLLEGYIEIVKEDDPLAGRELQHVGKIKVYSWRGHDYIVDTDIDKAGVGWILAENWWPYQRPSFVTPPFAGYVSGHSTYSRAAAELLTLLTGDEYFPGGMGEFVAKKNEFLVFEEGPSMDVVLQWATYRDASDQCSLSRIWGGIHPPADDIPGRLIGEKVGVKAFDKARSYFSGTVLSADEELTSTHQLFPNPIRVNGWLTIRPILDKNYAVELFDLGGRSYDLSKQSIILSGRQLKIKMPAYLRRGIYLLKVGEETHKILIMK